MKPWLRQGLIAGGAMAGWTLLEYALGLHNTRLALGHYADHGPELILLVMLWRLLQAEVRRPECYWLPVWRGVLHGALASLVAAMVFYIFLNAYIGYLNPGWPDLYLEWQVARMRAAGETEVVIRGMARAFRANFSPAGLVGATIGLYPFLGGAASAILTLWLNWRHKEPGVVR